MHVLVGCEFSGTVREAFRRKGHDAWSCDLLPAEDGSKHHIQDDVRRHLCDGWDVAILFPPCTDLCVSGARWFAEKKDSQENSLDFVARLMLAPISHIAIENPIGIISTKIRKPDQIVQPWQFGHGETKATCLWLKNLPKLKPTSNVYDWEQARYDQVVTDRIPRIAMMPPSDNRGKERGRTYQGIADAMAGQWTEETIQRQGVLS